MRVLGEIGADVVALQEADRRLGQRSATLAEDELRRTTGFRIARHEGVGRSSGWHGNVILVREGIAVRRTCGVDLPSLEPRGALIAEVEIDGRALRIVGVHLGLRSSDRAQQAKALLRELEARADGMATVILGDLNEWRSSGAALTELSKTFKLSPPQRSFHTAVPMAPLDRILVGPGLQIEAAKAHRSMTARRASDHLPVWADVVRTAPSFAADAGSRQRESAPLPA